MGKHGHRQVRKAAAAAAVACALGVGALAGATSASAADSLNVTVKEYDLTLPNGVTDPAGIRQMHLMVSHDNAQDLPDATVTIDAGGLAGVADVVWPKECTHTGAVGTCTLKVTDLSLGDAPPEPETYLTLGLNPAAGAKDGAQGELSYTATSGNLKAIEEATDIHIGSGADLVIQPLKDMKDLKPGSTFTQHVEWKNTGNEAAQQTVLVMHSLVGFEPADRYSNCVYGPLSDGRDATTVCTIDTPLAPGQSLQLSSDLTYRTTSALYSVYGSVQVLPPGPEADAAKAAVQGTPGAGPELTATPVAASGKVAPLTAELNPADNTAHFVVKGDNHAHYYATGASVEGDKGDTVPVTVGLGNEGPATIFDISGGDGTDMVKVTFPKGTTVTEVPDGCRLHWVVGVKGHGPYLCEGDVVQPAGYKKTFTFQVRLDDQLVNARGTAALTTENDEVGGVPTTFPWDTGTKDYTRPVVFNGTADPSAAPSANAPGADGDAATQVDQPSSPELAATGASGTTPLFAGGAVLLLAAGGAVTLAARRRTAPRR